MPKKSDKDYVHIGRVVSAIAESADVDKKALYRTAFIKGIFSGLGGVIGATVVLVLLLWVLSLLGDIPFIGRIFENLRSAVESAR